MKNETNNIYLTHTQYRAKRGSKDIYGFGFSKIALLINLMYNLSFLTISLLKRVF